MTNIDPKVLKKIKKCLALGASPNPNEAAVAMRQAHALMRQHGVDAKQVTMSEIGESTSDVRTMARDKPADWEASLAFMVGKAFGCKMLISRALYEEGIKGHVNEGQFIFIGQKAQAEVAAYTASVLSRKCKKARQDWIAENFVGASSVKGWKAKATRMGDLFAEGWVHSIGKLVSDFANPPEINEAINLHIAEKNASKENAPTRGVGGDKLSSEEIVAVYMGCSAASGESIHRPMNSNGPQVAIGT